MPRIPSLARRILVWAAVGATVYFGNVEVQSWLGRRALASTGLEIHSLDEAFALALESNRLVLADVSAIWCSSCRKLDSVVFSDPGVKATLESRFVFVRLEYESEEGRAFQEEYGLRGFPTLLVLDAKGSPVRRLSVTYDPATFRAMLEEVAGT